MKKAGRSPALKCDCEDWRVLLPRYFDLNRRSRGLRFWCGRCRAGGQGGTQAHRPLRPRPHRIKLGKLIDTFLRLDGITGFNRQPGEMKSRLGTNRLQLLGVIRELLKLRRRLRDFPA